MTSVFVLRVAEVFPEEMSWVVGEYAYLGASNFITSTKTPIQATFFASFEAAKAARRSRLGVYENTTFEIVEFKEVKR